MRQHNSNPFENRRDMNLELHSLQHSNGNFAVPNFAEKMPPTSNFITNVHSPEQQIVPNLSISSADQAVSKIRQQVDRQIAQVWSNVGVSMPPLHDSYLDDRSEVKTRGHKMPPKAVPDYEAPQYSSPQQAASQYSAPQYETPSTPQYESPQDSTPSPAQGDGGQNYQQQSRGSSGKGDSQERTGGDGGDGGAGNHSTENKERTSSSDNTSIHMGAARDLTIAGPPTISAQTIDAVLSANHSPVAGQGQEIFQKCVDAGIDPAIALAFFGCESTFGTDGIAVQTNSWGNIRATDGVSSIDGFAAYSNFQEGLDDWIRLMKDVYLAPNGFGVTTADQALQKYAPPSENDTNGYAAKVANFVSEWRGMEAELPHDETSKLGEAVDKTRKAIGTVGGIARDALQKMFFTQFSNPEWNNYDTAPDSSANCGPASLAMALRVLGVDPGGIDGNLYGDPNPLVMRARQLMTGAPPTPEQNQHQYTNIGQAFEAAAGLGLTAEWEGSIAEINHALDANKPVVLAGNPIAYNTGMTGDQYATDGGVVYTGGHMVTVVKRNGDGTYVVMDPAYKQGLLTLTQDQLANYMDGPGVAISRPTSL